MTWLIAIPVSAVIGLAGFGFVMDWFWERKAKKEQLNRSIK